MLLCLEKNSQDEPEGTCVISDLCHGEVPSGEAESRRTHLLRERHKTIMTPHTSLLFPPAFHKTIIAVYLLWYL